MGALRGGLGGALRLAYLDPGGVGLFPMDRAGALRSFWVYLLLLPGAVALDNIDRWMGTGGNPAASLGVPARALAPLGHAVPAVVLTSIVAPLAYFLMVAPLLRRLGRGLLFPRFVAAANWSNLVMLAVVLPVVALAYSGLVSPPMALAMQMVAQLWSLFYECYVIRAVLGSGWLTALGFALLDTIVAYMANGAIYVPLTMPHG